MTWNSTKLPQKQLKVMPDGAIRVMIKHGGNKGMMIKSYRKRTAMNKNLNRLKKISQNDERKTLIYNKLLFI